MDMKQSLFFKHETLFKGEISGLTLFLATESPLKMMRNAFYFTSKALFILKILKILSRLFGHGEKLLDKKDMADFKIYYVITWETNN